MPFGFGKKKKPTPAQQQAAAPQPRPQQESVEVHTGPGVVSTAGPGNVFRVTIPFNVEPGSDFQVFAGDRLVRVRCPPDSTPGQTLQISLPGGGQNGQGSGPSAPAGGANSPGVEPAPNNGYTVRVPGGVAGGQQFPVMINGRQLMVSCPPNGREGMRVQIFPGVDMTNNPAPPQRPTRPISRVPNNMQMFEVVVPHGVTGGQPFALMAAGQRILVTCPPNAIPGQRIRFPLPNTIIQNPVSALENKKEVAERLGVDEIALNYDGGWARTIRVGGINGDFKFQWVRQNGEEGAVDMNARFDAKTSAYVRKIEFSKEDDHRQIAGTISLVPATDALVDSRIMLDGEEVVGYSDIANAQTKSFDEKVEWFQQTCNLLSVEWNHGHMRLNVRREYLLGDSVSGVMGLSQKDLRKVWRLEFIGEEGIDAGGLTREWYQLITEELFDPQSGLWIYSATNQMCMQINPASGLINEEHLVYFRFLGRIMGKALFDRQLVAGHMVRHLYKHILGWPVTFEDLELVDEDVYRNMKTLLNLTAEELEYAYLDFTITECTMGVNASVELIPDGADVDLTIDNLPEYLEANMKYRLIENVRPQLTAILLGFFDVIPEPLMTIFDFQELELLMCGLPRIDIDDWKANTLYTGEFDGTNGDNLWCHWFWDIVENDFDQETRARLLQFVTGTSGVPSGGFAVLQGNDGNIRKFTIHGVDAEICLYPHAHTCFNRIDLPTAANKEELHERLKFSVQMASTGFGME